MADIKSSETQTGGKHRPAQTEAAAETSPRHGDGAQSAELAAGAERDSAGAHYPGQNALRSAGAAGGGAVGMTHDVLRQAISATEDVGSGLVGGATHLAQDIVHGVRDLAVDATVVVRDGASGLIGAAGEVGSRTVHAVTDLLVEVVGGARHIADAAMGRAEPDGRARQARARGTSETGARTSIADEAADEAAQADTSQYRQQQTSRPSGGASPGA